MEPVTMALVAAVTLAATTHRPKWEDQLLPEQSSTVLVLPKREATSVPLIDRRGGMTVGQAGSSLKEKLYQELMTFIPTGEEDPSIEPVSKVEEILAANDFLQKFPGSIPLPTLQRNYEGHIGMYWDNDVVYIDVDIDSGSTMSLYAREQSTSKQLFIEEIQLDQIDADWLEVHIGKVLNSAALA
jgi:hypothetical protein